jgi:pseudouridine-5'-phosphate glycosidase
VTHPLLSLHPEVAAALAERRPVVALESTIISHGMPYPQNVETARDVEALVRANGATPATIAVLDGRCVVGLSHEQLESVGDGRGGEVHKTTTRDLPWLLANRMPGATTVAATMRIAHLAGIRVFATGGIGGVHRGAPTTFDISADLAELANTPVAVVCAGVKSILDIGLTLEHLETLGVPVLVDGADEFPSFYSRTSGYDAPRRLDGPTPIAAFLGAQTALGLRSGAVIANPIPHADEIPRSEIDGIIAVALEELDRAGVHGREVTPWLLGRIVEATAGRSLTANIALVKNNAALAAQLAGALASL